MVAAISVHAIGIDHEFELLSVFMEDVNKLEGVLEMDIIIPGSVGNLEHDFSVSLADFHRISPYSSKNR